MQILLFSLFFNELLGNIQQISLDVVFKMDYQSIPVDKHVPNKLGISVSVNKQKKMCHIHMSPVACQFQNKQ